MSAAKRLGLVTRQASFNAVHILLGTVAGAVNTVVVLPRAFAEQDGRWGVIIVLTSWALIFAQLLNLGTPNTLMRFMPRYKDEPAQSRALQGFSFSMLLLGIAALGGCLLLGKEWFLSFFQQGDAAKMRDHIGLLFMLFACMTLNVGFTGFLWARLSTTITQFVQETFLKTTYLAAAFAYLMGWIDYTWLLWLYTGSYAMSTLILGGLALQRGLRPSLQWNGLPLGELVSYGLFSVLDRGIAVIVHRTDFVMMAILLSLSKVEAYNLAFYIAAVAMIPQKAISAIVNPLMAKAIHAQDRTEMQTLYTKSALNQLLVGGLIFGCTWASIDEVMLLLPERYAGGKWVVLFIGISRLVYLMSGAAGALIQFSKWYRANFVLNLGFFALTVASNYFCMSPDWFDLGMEGAALATAGSFVIYNTTKVMYVRQKHGMHMFSRNLVAALLLTTIPAVALHGWHPLEGMPFWAIVLKSGGLFAVVVTTALYLEISEDGQLLVNKLLRRS